MFQMGKMYLLRSPALAWTSQKVSRTQEVRYPLTSRGHLTQKYFPVAHKKTKGGLVSSDSKPGEKLGTWISKGRTPNG